MCILTISDRKAHAAPLFRQIDILKVYDVNKLQIACFYKAMHYLSPLRFKDYFVLNSSIYNHNLRNNDNVKRYNSRTNGRFYCIKCYDPKSGMTLIPPLEILLVYMCLGDRRISIYFNMYNNLVVFEY